MASDPQLETKLPNGVYIYGEPDVTIQIAGVVAEVPEIWEDKGGFVDLPEEHWMEIPLKYKFLMHY